MDSVVRNLIGDVRALLGDRARWTQKHMARNADGYGVGPRDPKACQWCLIGAIMKCCKGDSILSGAVVTELAWKKDKKDILYLATDLVTVNDIEGYSSVIKVLDKALEEPR